MNLRNIGWLNRMPLFAVVIGLFAGASYAQFTVGISTSASPPLAAPSSSFTVTATISSNPNPIAKVVFYRNDVPYKTLTGSPWQITEDQLGQDLYTYRARAYDSTGVWVDSGEDSVEVRTPRVFRLGPNVNNGPGAPATQGPGKLLDHTQNLRDAIAYLESQSGNPGGTIVFPCTFGQNDGISIYNISSTVNIPSNITLQGESAEAGANCRIYWNDPNPNPPPTPGPNFCSEAPEYTRGIPMFRITGGATRVRFRDLGLYARNIGPDCAGFNDSQYGLIEDFGNTAIEIDAGYDQGCIDNPKICSSDPGGTISDVIFENIMITNFKYGIRATSGEETEHEITDIKVRGYRPISNFRQLSVDAPYAYNWDVQNMNLTGMMAEQGAVEILNAGKPARYTGDNGDLRFLQLNCNGNGALTPEFCVNVVKHGGLYFKELHHEGVSQAIEVQNIYPAENADPIVFETSIATGEFHDQSMKLYLIGSIIFTGPDVEGLRFSDGALNSSAKLVDCGDLHNDLTDVDPGSAVKTWMLFTHGDRNRGSFFANASGNEYIKPHTICPSGVFGVTNINEVGGKPFDNGVLPTEAMMSADTLKQYTNVLVPASCPNPSDLAACIEGLMSYDPPGNPYVPPVNGGALYIPGNATYQINRQINVLRGREIIGGPGAKLVLTAANSPLFFIRLYRTTTDQFGVSGIVFRNLELETAQSGATGIEMTSEEIPSGELPGCSNNTLACVGVSRDLYFSGLTITGFTWGLRARQYPGQESYSPMIDGVGMKNITFINNATGFASTSQNASNWNVMNLKMQWASAPAVGWDQLYGGLYSLQNVTCQGVANPGENSNDCISLKMVGMLQLSGLKKPQNVTNGLNIRQGFPAFPDPYNSEPQYTHLTLRNNDLTGTSVKLEGKAYVTSMNNKYGSFNVAGSDGDKTRLTYCGDTYTGTPYDGLDTEQNSNWVGIPIPSRIECGTDPMAWEDAVRWTRDPSDNFENTTPLLGNFFDGTYEDFVVYQAGSPYNTFTVQQPGGPGRAEIQLGSGSDIPLVGRFFPNSPSHLVAFHPQLTGSPWMVCGHTTCNPASPTYVWNWGSTGDVPFVGNFFDESGPVSGNMDEIAIYRPNNGQIWITNPRSGAMLPVLFVSSNMSNIQVGDFLGRLYDQIAQFEAGTGLWHIIDPRTGDQYQSAIPNLSPDANDRPVAARYLPGVSGHAGCIQMGVWRPADQKYHIGEAVPTPIGGAPTVNCATRDAEIKWGWDLGTPTNYADDDVPLAIRYAGAKVRRPVVYRRTRLASFPYSISDGQWWVHDRFP